MKWKILHLEIVHCILHLSHASFSILFRTPHSALSIQTFGSGEFSTFVTRIWKERCLIIRQKNDVGEYWYFVFFNSYFSPESIHFSCFNNSKFAVTVCCRLNIWLEGRHGGLMVSALVPGVSGPGSSPGRGYCAVFLDKTRSHNRGRRP